MVGLGDLANGIKSNKAYDASWDGTTIIGAAHSVLGQEAFYWTEEQGMVGIGELPGGVFNSAGVSCSYDGTMITGFSVNRGGIHAFSWTDKSGMIPLGDLFGGADYSKVWGMNSDGSELVGQSTSDVAIEACRWVDGQIVSLGIPNYSRALDVSEDGQVIVGFANGGAFLWTPEGMQYVQDVLVDDYGLDLTGWVLTSTQAVSADGTVLVGVATNPTGEQEAWICEFNQ